tara:strand:+ start:2358 stop:3401 length:1044 start_codon:yes stop_codon:yes gene_type:complete
VADRYYSNADPGQRFQPAATAEAGQVNGKLDEITTGFQEVAIDTDRSLKLPSVIGTSQEINATPLQRRRMVVGFDADGNLTLLQGFGWRGDWVTATEYFVNDVFRDPATKNIYVTITRHTSDASLSTDITAGRVELAISVEDIEAAKQAAQDARDLSLQYRDESRTARDTSIEAKESALSAANFKGLWLSLDGSLAKPASVKHSGQFWELLNDLADVTTSEPGVSGDWTSKTTLTGNATGPINMSGFALNIQWGTKTTTYTAVAGDRLLADTSAGAFTITLPATPASGDEVWFADSGANWATNNLTVSGNGKNVDGAATFAADVNQGHFAAVYNGVQWVIRLAGGVA